VPATHGTQRLVDEHEGLRIDPCLPADWDGFDASRRFRGASYRISARKPRGVLGRVGHLMVDGQRIEGNLVPPASTGTTVTVEAAIQALPDQR
jgi:cellobiose phosphorylase